MKRINLLTIIIVTMFTLIPGCRKTPDKPVRVVPKEYIGKDITFYYNEILSAKGKPYHIDSGAGQIFNAEGTRNDDIPYVIVCDIKNGYLEILENGCQCHGDWTFAGYFYDAKKTPYMFISSNYYAVKDFAFLTPSGKRWVDVKDEVFPKIDYTMYVSEPSVKISSKLGKILQYGYRIPRIGTTVKARINDYYLKAIIQDYHPGPDSDGYDKMISTVYSKDESLKTEIRAFLKNLKYDTIELLWDMNAVKFSVGKGMKDTGN